MHFSPINCHCTMFSIGERKHFASVNFHRLNTQLSWMYHILRTYVPLDRRRLQLTIDRFVEWSIVFDANLKFNRHVDHVIQKVRSHTGAAIRFAKEIKHRRILTNILQTYIAPITEYGSPVWSNIIKKTKRNWTKFTKHYREWRWEPPMVTETKIKWHMKTD